MSWRTHRQRTTPLDERPTIEAIRLPAISRSGRGDGLGCRCCCTCRHGTNIKTHDPRWVRQRTRDRRRARTHKRT